MNEVIVLEKNSFSTLLIKFEDKNVNPAMFIQANIKVGSGSATQLIGDIFGNIIINNV